MYIARLLIGLDVTWWLSLRCQQEAWICIILLSSVTSCLCLLSLIGFRVSQAAGRRSGNGRGGWQFSWPDAWWHLPTRGPRQGWLHLTRGIQWTKTWGVVMTVTTQPRRMVVHLQSATGQLSISHLYSSLICWTQSSQTLLISNPWLSGC